MDSMMSVDFAYPLTALVTVFVTFLIFVFSAKVGKLRMQTGIKAPAMVGDEKFECANRVHCNTIEQAVIFLPVLWLFAIYYNDLYACIAGALWIIGRIMYANGYMNAPEKRSMGFMLGFLVFVGLAIAVLYKAVMAVL